jgi:hybrid cluster-associated redox disulfide protein
LFQRNDHLATRLHVVRIATRTKGMKPRFSDDATMDAIMREWPATIRVVLQHGMLCVGCPIAAFHTVSEAAREHGLNEESLRFDLHAAIKRTEAD